MLMRTPACLPPYDALDSLGPLCSVPKAPDAADLKALLRTHKPIQCQPRQVLFHEGDKADSVFLLTSGVIRLYRFMPNGRRMVARFVFPEEIVGLAFDEICPFTAEAIKPTSVSKMALSQLNALCAHSTSLQNDVVALLKYELASAQDDLLPMVHQTAEARIARLLCILAKRNGDPLSNSTKIHLAMTRADIADFLGLTIETVCRGFTKLKGEGLISAPAPDEIRLENANSLVSLAEGES